mmetsp:Transcript_18425/g.39588  ORF Transcript_18425/g.39588 Transcript_18425/m.39588 type:complete len:263 (+) Transcript_18425:612-1400(+)
MWELQIYPSRMQVNRIAKILPRHCTALQVPPGPAPADAPLLPALRLNRRVPYRVLPIKLWLVRLPEAKIPNPLLLSVVLVGVHAATLCAAPSRVDARALLQLIGIQLHQPGSVPLLLRDVEVPAPLVALVGQPVPFQVDDQLGHFVDVVRCPGVDTCLHDVERLQVVEELPLELSRQFQQAHALPVASLDDLVVHVRQIANVIDVVPQIRQDSLQDVVRQEGAEVSHVGGVVNGGSAGVHCHARRGLRHEGRFCTRERIVES